jgi:hypothetical protein
MITIRHVRIIAPSPRICQQIADLIRIRDAGLFSRRMRSSRASSQAVPTVPVFLQAAFARISDWFGLWVCPVLSM